MTLGQTVRARVEARAPFHDHVEDIVASEAGVVVHCHVAVAERLGLAVHELTVRREEPHVLAAPALMARAASVCGRVTYLLEQFQTIEVDPVAHAALLRSKKPCVRASQISYFELCLKNDDQAVLHRYCYDKTTRSRTAVDFSLTNDQLERLVDDLMTLDGVSN